VKQSIVKLWQPQQSWLLLLIVVVVVVDCSLMKAKGLPARFLKRVYRCNSLCWLTRRRRDWRNNRKRNSSWDWN